MATIQDRPYSRDYSGLRNQLEVGGFLVAVCFSAYELMRRKRRGRGLVGKVEDGLGSVETWEWGYLYQGRCWAKNPSPALPKWPLAWVFQVLRIPERSLPDLLGLDATLYIRFMRACVCFTALHTCTTFPVLFSIHVIYSPADISDESINKASISSLVGDGSRLRLLYIHVALAYWVSITWVLTLLWIARGIFRYRALAVQSAAESLAQGAVDDVGREKPVDENRALRLRTIMVTNVPHQLRSNKDLKEYFEYYMSRPLGTAPITPGFFARLMTFLFNRAAASAAVQHFKAPADEPSPTDSPDTPLPAIVDRVVIARKTTELASLLARRDDVLKKLEHAHVRLARKALQAAREHMDNPSACLERQGLSRISSRVRQHDEEAVAESAADRAARLDAVVEALAPFTSLIDEQPPTPFWAGLFGIRGTESRRASDKSPSVGHGTQGSTIWEALHSLPRAYLDEYQPLIRLHALFRGAYVPAIDYYAAKLGLLTALINENRGRPLEAFPPSSTAFVTFETIADARRAAKYLQVHPRNPLACDVVPAPDVRDLDWVRIMKSSFVGEFLKDWVINLGVWAFTCLWIIPISLFVGLVTIQNLSFFIPGLPNYLNKHRHSQEFISSLLPTILVSILTILVPMLLLLIAKKAHTIITLSKLHDTIMIRYWKFLVCNLLIFFCVGVAALESFLQSFGKSVNPLPVVAASFPTAGPFYVGWLILQTAIHGFLELALFGLPLLVYPATRAAKTLRRRATGIRPRTFNFYYWLPNHVLVATITMCFALLNPLVIPFAFVYFCVESVIVKHQLVHVYAKTYDNNGKLILIRIVRYSLDGLLFAHVVFLAFLVVLKLEVQAALEGVLLSLTVIVKIILTRICRAKFEQGDRAMDSVYSGRGEDYLPQESAQGNDGDPLDAVSRIATLGSIFSHRSSRYWTWRRPAGVPFSYSSVPARLQRQTRRGPNPFGPNTNLARATSLESPTRASHDKSAPDAHHPTLSKENNQILTRPDSSERAQAPPNHQNNTATRASTERLLVTNHAKHPNWDDFPHLNRPYQNPYYAQEIDNFLWLPRNPFGVLDLDDSVNLHRALTTEPGGGQLGEWMNEGTRGETGAAPQPLAETPSSMPSDTTDMLVQKGFPFRRERQVSGTEEISMSSVLSARVSRIAQEDEVERAVPRRSPFLATTLSSAGRLSSNVRTRRPTLYSRASYPPVHSLGRSVSGFPSFQQKLGGLPTSSRSYSGTHDPVHEPDIQAEAVFIQPTSDVPTPTRERREPSGSSVPMRQAVVEEIMAEAQEEAIDRVWREEEEKQRETQRSSWFTSWMWKRSYHGDPRPLDSHKGGG